MTANGMGRLFAVVGPSGAGKDTLIDAGRAARPDLLIVRRVITRAEARAIEQAFASASNSDVAAIDKAIASIMALRNGGQANMTAEMQISSILEQIRPARERLRTLQQQRDADIAKVLGTSTCQG
jgi:ABC-type glutathione transport system ATPase component